MRPVTREDTDYEVGAALAFHDDDAKATIATLLADHHHWRLQLAPAKVLGIGRRKGSSALWNTEILGDRSKPNLIALRDTSS
ncbi:hypothetical protein GGE12_004052 [Rhizobium mongolense]|uniref:Uncharacterized protein n=1 Tax=Rhizobium mongolense TaxID=57676 RepID=A0A7W6RQX2_9HYPH|nr:hypothetical protein [Rhizobium mongolense]MBB4276255.1 hypothetical protein [Rhizobium mongolense]